MDTRLRNTPLDRTSPMSSPILKSMNASIDIPRIVVIALLRIGGVASERACVMAATLSGLRSLTCLYRLVNMIE